MRYVVVTFALCLLIVSAYAGTHVENFDDGDLDGWQICNFGLGNSEWKVGDGVLTCRRSTSWSCDLMFGEEEWRNYSIECDARMVEVLANPNSIGLDLRVTDCNDSSDFSDVWCVFSMGWQQAFIWPWLNGNEAGGTARKDVDFQLSRWYRLKGIANEDNFEFHIDGELIASLSDSRFPTGRVGFAVGASVAHFDNVVIIGDDVPDNTAAVSVSSKLATTWGHLRSQ